MKNQSIDAVKAQKETTIKTLKYQCEKDREKVKGMFHFYECPGGTLKFPFKAYKWDKVETYELTDGQICTVPLGVAKHLNKNGWYPLHQYQLDATGKPVMNIGQKKRRFGFQSLEFIDPEEIGMSKESEIVTASPIV